MSVSRNNEILRANQSYSTKCFFISCPSLWVHSTHVMWLVLFILFFALSKIADQMIVISFIGFISNFISSFIFRAARGDRNEA